MKYCILICFTALSFSHPLPGQTHISVENQEKMLDSLLTYEIQILEKKEQVLIQLGDMSGAEIISNSISEIKDDLSARKIDHSQLSSELTLSLQTNQHALDEERTKRRQTAQASIFTFLILGLGIIFFRNQRATADQKRRIAEHDRSVFKTELECKECELANMSTYVIQKNELLDSLKKDVDYFSNLLTSKEERAVLKPLRSKLKEASNGKNDWQEFEKQFMTAYPGYLETLSHNFPDLTPADMKICTYLKMNQNTKEIANLAGLSIRSVESRRYRLRKKLNLSPNTNLVTFLHSLNISGNGTNGTS
jgi:DNA-binding CsgD family transcriptional regulator